MVLSLVVVVSPVHRSEAAGAQVLRSSEDQLLHVRLHAETLQSLGQATSHLALYTSHSVAINTGPQITSAAAAAAAANHPALTMQHVENSVASIDSKPTAHEG